MNCAKCGVKSPIIKREPGIAYLGPFHSYFRGQTRINNSKPPDLARTVAWRRAGRKSERDTQSTAAQGEAPADRAGRIYFFSLSPQPKLLPQLPGNLHDREIRVLMILWRPVNHGKCYPNRNYICM